MTDMCTSKNRDRERGREGEREKKRETKEREREKYMDTGTHNPQRVIKTMTHSHIWAHIGTYTGTHNSQRVIKTHGPSFASESLIGCV